ncbi:MAG: hypothetical protein AB7Q23_03285 [Hyphomonadaceae bacterium]
MKRVLVGAALAAALTTAAYAQNTTLAPWFDSDGFYNRAGVTFERATNDMLACRVEAARLRVVRNTNSRTPTGAAFDPSGAYDPVVSGVATGIASILFAIQDARYNGSIEHIEFRDCIVALGYRHYRLGRRDRERFNAEPDHGFAALVAAAAPADGRLNESETERNYFAAAAAPSRYANAAAPAPVSDEPAAATGAPTDPGAPVPVTVAPQGVIQRLAPGEIATAQPGAAIVVIAASQLAGAMENPMAGDTFRFRRVPQDGAFLDLLQPAASFGVRSHINSERRRDATLAGEFRDPRYSTYVIPAGRYVLSDLGTLNACLGTLTFEAREGEVLYLGDFVLRPPSVPIGSVLNPIGNLNSGMDNRLRADLRVGIGDNLEAARAALQAEDAARTRLARVRYENGYRIPCTGRYIGRVANPDWPAFSADQPARFHDAMAAAVAAAQ